MKDSGYLGNERGFTLVEIMFSTVLLSFLFMTVWGLYNNSIIFWKHSEYKVDMYDSLQVSLDRMGRELMFARCPDASYPASGYPGGVLVNSNINHLYFETDGTPPRKIHYYCASNTLYRQVDSDSPQPLASDIQSVAFTYYNNTGAEVSPVQSIESAKTIRQVKIVLTAKKQGTTISPASLVQKVSLRSL